MALVSPGIQVTVTDQSNYVPSSNGTVPYILLATAQDKTAPGSGIASGTTATNAGKLYAITSQRDLVNTFGNPVFQTTSTGSALNGSELNEYGLLAAYSALSVSNQVFVQRADVPLQELQGSTIRPTQSPANGAYWLDVSSSNYGLYVWDAASGTFTEVTPLVDTEVTTAHLAPDALIGAVGNYIITTSASPMCVFYKTRENQWVELNTDAWKLSVPAVIGTVSSPIIGNVGGVLTVNSIANVALTTGMNVTTIIDEINSTLSANLVSGVEATIIDNSVVFSISSDSASNGVDADGTLRLSGSVLADIGIVADDYYAPEASFAPYYSQPEWFSFDDFPRPSGSIWVKTTQVGGGVDLVVKQYSSSSATWGVNTVTNYYDNSLATYNLDPINGGLSIPSGTLFAKYDDTGTGKVDWTLWYRKNTGATVATGFRAATTSADASNVTIKVTQPGQIGTNGYAYSENLSFGANTSPASFVSTIKTLGIPYLDATINTDGYVVITHDKGGDVNFTNIDGNVLIRMGLTTAGTNIYADNRSTSAVILSNWAPLSSIGYYVATSTPSAAPADGTLWYWNTPTRVDVMIHDGSAWRGYRNVTNDIRGYNLSNTDPNGVIVQSTEPTKQSDGTSNLVDGDLWLDTSDLENFPKLYRRQSVSGLGTWALIDNTDTTSQNGMIFADARWGVNGDTDPVFGTIASPAALADSDYVDLDAPSAALYPRGMLMFNTRATSYNVKRFVSDYFNTTAFSVNSYNAGTTYAQGDRVVYSSEIYVAVAATSFSGEAPLISVGGDEVVNSDYWALLETGAWVSNTGYQHVAGVPNFGRHAQRGVVVAALKSAIDSSTALREDQNLYNLVACPGYPELIPNMISLNNDRNNTAFVIGDTPLRLPANGTDITAWATNSTNQSQTNEQGLVNHDPYLAVYYPNAQTNDLSGNSVVVPASHAMIRTFIRSDNASYPWFAPAGTLRGVLDNVSSVGYLDATSGTFVSIGVTQGLRDLLYTNSINPLTYLQGAGLVCYGNKTTASSPSALDRINVARLVNYIRLQLDRLARPFIFEPNDPVTRNQIKAVVDSLLNDIVAKRGISDYLVVCDASNNTADRIARNELYVDVAIQPTKDVEFIYIPIRLKNPGELESGNIAPSQAVGTGA